QRSKLRTATPVTEFPQEYVPSVSRGAHRRAVVAGLASTTRIDASSAAVRENVTPSGPDHPRRSLSVVRTAVANTSPSTGRPSSPPPPTDRTVPPPGAGLSPGTTASAPPRAGATTTTSPRSPEPGSATGGSGGCSATGGSGVVIPGSADGAGSGAVIASGRGASRSSAGARSG